jgi:hypothetical protein
MNVDDLLSRFDRVRTRGHGQWSCRCPAHDDDGPSCSIRELPDGRVLVHCFAGCEVQSILDAVGLEMSHLFPPKPRSEGGGHAPVKRRALMTPSQALEIARFECLLIAVAGQNLAAGHVLTTDDLARLSQASSRVEAVFEEVSA